MRIANLLISLLISSSSLAQQPVSQTDIIRGVAQYRSLVIEHSPDFPRFEKSLKVLQSYGVTEDEVYDLFHYSIMLLDETMNILRKFYLKDIDKLIRKIGRSKDKNRNKLGKDNAEIIVNEILNTRQLVELAFIRAIKPLPPHPIDPESTLFEEIAFYDLRNGEKIADIGAGTGDFDFILASILEDEEIYSNEIDPISLEVLHEKRKTFTEIVDSTNFKIINGSVSSTNLPNDYFDKILMRESLHHFIYKEQMMSDIYSKLKKGGVILVSEQDGSEANKKKFRVCPFSMSVSSVRATIESAGFIEEKSITIGTSYHMIFTK